MASCPLPPVWPVFIFYLLAPLGQPSLTLPASSSRLPSPGLPSTAPARPESGFMAGSSASCPRSAWSALFSTLAAVSPEGPHLPASHITNSERLYLQPSPALGIPSARHPAESRIILPFPPASLLPFLCPQPWHRQATCPPSQKTSVHFLRLLSAHISTSFASSAKMVLRSVSISCLCHSPRPALLGSSPDSRWALQLVSLALVVSSATPPSSFSQAPLPHQVAVTSPGSDLFPLALSCVLTRDPRLPGPAGSLLLPVPSC